MTDEEHPLGKEVPMLDMDDADFPEQLDFAFWSTGGSSDYDNSRDRPYNGQSWTDEGERGKTEVKGLTMRDIRDCLVKAMLISTPPTLDDYKEWAKCWDFSSGEAKPTQYLLDHQDEPDFISTKVELGTWRTRDVYKIDFSRVDPLAIANNLTCEIEKMMGIFPNIKRVDDGTNV